MTQEERDKLDEDILKLMGTREWLNIAENLKKDIYNLQASMMEVDTWDKVNELRGFCQGITYIINLRDTVIQARKQEAQDADV